MKNKFLCKIFGIVVASAIAVAPIHITVYAQTGIYGEDAERNIYFTQTGWVKFNGNLYYVHATKSQMYDEHEVCRNTFRWRGNKLYYFDHSGKAVEKNTKYIKFNADGSVSDVYTPGTNHTERWHADNLSYQERTKDGEWKNVGHQTNLWWKCDWQE